MEPIDTAAAAFEELRGEMATYAETVVSEQDTRSKVIDRFLQDVLAWPYGEFKAEEEAGGRFVDYKCTVNRLARLVIEAKRDGRSLGLQQRAGGRAYKLGGKVFHTEAAREGIRQAIHYCALKSAELACVTNGREWIVFRGNRLGDGHDTLDGQAFVFPDLESISEHFALFYDLLSYEGVSEYRFRALFQEAEGQPIRAASFSKPLRDQDTRQLLVGDKLASDLNRVMTSFFRRLSGDDDPDLIVECFVVTKESTEADRRLARVAEDLVGRIRDVDTGHGRELAEVIERVKATQRNEFVLLVGTKGAGKTTFMDRFFKHVLKDEIVDECVIARVNLADSEGDDRTVTAWLNQNLLEAVERAAFGENEPRFEDIQAMFYDEYNRRRSSTLKDLYERDKEEFRIDFGRHIERRREERPHEYITRLLHHIVTMRQKVPCLIFDNADHFTIEFQERVFQYARSLYESEVCLVVMPITDRTSWQLSRDGALQSFESESLFLPTPPPDRILGRRVDFLQKRIAEEKAEPGRGYFLGRGIPLSIENLTAFSATLEAIFLQTDHVARWIGDLANRDVRLCLELTKDVVASPHLKVDELLKTYLSTTGLQIPLDRVKDALILGRYDIFPAEHRFVRNVFAMNEDSPSSPLTGLRILQLLRDAQKGSGKSAFVSVDQVLEYHRAMGLEPGQVLEALGKLLAAGLILSYDPTVTEVAQVRRVELAPSGFRHLRWATRDKRYVTHMLPVTSITDPECFEQLDELSTDVDGARHRKMLKVFVDYLIVEDSSYCHVQQHPAYKSQSMLTTTLERLGSK